MGLPFEDRNAAGIELAAVLDPLELQDLVVLGVPRGGVAVAFPVAEELGVPLDVIVVRKIGAPNNPELGLGAVGAWGEPWLDERLVATVGATREHLAREIEVQRDEAARRETAYRGDMPPVAIEGRDVVVVDDGVATGGTVVAAAKLLRSQRPRQLLLAVPVGPKDTPSRIGDAYDQVIVLYAPEPFTSVGQWYRDFHQVSDAEVTFLLAGA